jgi:hypothetical protein
MSKNGGSHYENHQRAAEMHELTAHTHQSAEDHRGKQDHQTGQEQSRQAMEHGQKEFLRKQEEQREQHEGTGLAHEKVAALAHELWVARGCPEGSPDEDWSKALAQLAGHKA